MAKSAITLAAPPADEAADALLSTKKLIKPKKSGSIKGILAAAAAVSFALGLAATTATLPTGWLISQDWSVTVEGGLVTSNTSRRVVGQWGGTGGAICEDHFGMGRARGSSASRVMSAC